MHRSARAAAMVAACFLLAGNASAQIVRGQVVDSVTLDPLRGVEITVLDTAGGAAGVTRTDENGLFQIQLGAARYRIRAAYDGYITSTFPAFDVDPDEVLSYMLLLPNDALTIGFARRVARLCASAGTGRPSIAGWIRDGVTGDRIGGASVSTAWASVPSLLSYGVSLGEYEGSVVADSTGFFAVCGVPVQTKVWLHAAADEKLSNFSHVSFGDRGVLVDGRAYALTTTTWRHDLVLRAPENRATTLSGVVTNAVTSSPVANAAVDIMGTALTAETDSTGRFDFPQLPSGPIRLTVRQIGMEQLQQELLLPQEGNVEIPRGMLVLGQSAQALDPLVVEATPGHDALAEFKIRRERGTGAFVTREEFMNRGSPARATDVLRNLSGVRVLRGRDFDRPWIVTMARGGPRTFGFTRGQPTDDEEDDRTDAGCPPLYFLDRHPIGNANSVQVDGAIPLEDVEAVEAHASVASMPTEFNRPGAHCGVIAFWTRFAEPRNQPVQADAGVKRSFINSTGFHFAVALGVVVGFFFGLGKAIHF